MWLFNKYVYIWMKFTRVTGRAGPHSFYAFPKSDSETTGFFTDSQSGLGEITVPCGETPEQAFKKYKAYVIEQAESQGYTNNQVLSIPKKNYDVLVRELLRDLQELEDDFYAPAYQGKRMVKR